MSTTTDTPAAITRLDPERGLFINGVWRDANGPVFDVHDPATGNMLASVANANPLLGHDAVSAAHVAGKSWAQTPTRRRSDLLRTAFDAMLQNRTELAALICAENGKPWADALAEVTYAAEFFRWFSEECVRSHGRYDQAPAGDARKIVTHHPVGVAVLITPWNFPAAMATRKIAPALAAGCTVVLKPAAETPLTAIAVVKLLEECGVPAGVVNLVPTMDAPGVVSEWLDDERVRKISFTGSTKVGRSLLRQASNRIVNASMELGGNAPFIVTENANVDAAVEGLMVAKFRNGGQACTAANRVYVHAEIHDEFVERVSERVSRLRVGPATLGECEVGPVISAAAVARIHKLIDDAVKQGAQATATASLPDTTDGYWIAPTVLTNVDPRARVMTEEIFGPVVPITAWTSEDALIAEVNRSPFALAAYVFAGDVGQAVRLGEKVEAGMVGINRGMVSDASAPFGGMKESGLGREGASEGISEYQETQYLSVDWPTVK